MLEIVRVLCEVIVVGEIWASVAMLIGMNLGKSIKQDDENGKR